MSYKLWLADYWVWPFDVQNVNRLGQCGGKTSSKRRVKNHENGPRRWRVSSVRNSVSRTFIVIKRSRCGQHWLPDETASFQCCLTFFRHIDRVLFTFWPTCNFARRRMISWKCDVPFIVGGETRCCRLVTLRSNLASNIQWLVGRRELNTGDGV